MSSISNSGFVRINPGVLDHGDDKAMLEKSSEETPTCFACRFSIFSFFEGLYRDYQASQEKSRREAAAIKIQSLFRGRAARSHYLARSEKWLNGEGAVVEIMVRRQPEALRDLKRATAGKTPVYFSSDGSIVIKETGVKQKASRFLQIREAHQICRREGFRHLVVPRGRPMGEYLLEEALPVSSNISRNMGIYARNAKLFTEAVRELTVFMYHANLSDLVNCQARVPLNAIVGDLVRYDNLPLYLERGSDGQADGRIALIDLEHSDLGSDRADRPSPERFYFNRVKDLVRIFPYHFDTIMEQATQLLPSIVKRGKELEEVRVRGETFLQRGYLDHHQSIIDRKVIGENLTRITPMSKKVTEELQSALLKTLESMNNGNNSYLDRYDERMPSGLFQRRFVRRAFVRKLPGMVEEIVKIMEKGLQANFKKVGEIDRADPVEVRSLAMKREFFLTPIQAFLRKYIRKELAEAMENGGPFYLDKDCAEEILVSIFRELARHGIVSGFVPGYGGHDFCHIAC